MQSSAEIFERKKQESLQLKKNAQKFAEKLARNKAEKVFMERLNPMTMFTEDKKRQFIEKMSKQYEPIFYKDIINKVITQKVMEEQRTAYSKSVSKSNKKNKKQTFKNERLDIKKQDTENDEENKDIAQSIINSSREVYDLLKTESNEKELLDNDEISDSILQNIEHCENIENTENIFSNQDGNGNLVMSILNKDNNEKRIKPTFGK
jgi:hypothetical protein